MKFILRTDHKNLLFIAEDSNPMIIRWYMAMQELDFTIEQFAGVKNLVADWLSRLCKNNMQDFPKEYEPEEVFLSAIMRDYTKSLLTSAYLLTKFTILYLVIMVFNEP